MAALTVAVVAATVPLMYFALHDRLAKRASHDIRPGPGDAAETASETNRRANRRATAVTLAAGAVSAAGGIAALVALWDTTTLAQRREIWSLTWDRILDRPFHGHGFFTFWEIEELTMHVLLRRGSAHNSLVEVGLALGLLGAIPFVTIIALAARNAALTLWRRPGPDSWLWAALATFLLVENVTESFVLWFSYNWVLLMAAAMRPPPPARSATHPRHERLLRTSPWANHERPPEGIRLADGKAAIQRFYAAQRQIQAAFIFKYRKCLTRRCNPSKLCYRAPMPDPNPVATQPDDAASAGASEEPCPAWDRIADLYPPGYETTREAARKRLNAMAGRFRDLGEDLRRDRDAEIAADHEYEQQLRALHPELAASAQPSASYRWECIADLYPPGYETTREAARKRLNAIAGRFRDLGEDLRRDRDAEIDADYDPDQESGARYLEHRATDREAVPGAE